jgi:hypothetical protein
MCHNVIENDLLVFKSWVVFTELFLPMSAVSASQQASLRLQNSQCDGLAFLRWL